MQRDLSAALRLTLVMFAAAQLLAVAGIVRGPLSWVEQMFGSEHFVFYAGSLLLHAWLLLAACRGFFSRPAVACLVAGALVDALLLVLMPPLNAPGPYYWIGVLSAGPGLAALVHLLVRWQRGSGDDQGSCAALLGVLAIIALYMLCIGAYLELTAAMHPATLDAVAYRIDALYGFTPSTAAGRAAAELPLLKGVLSAAYHMLPYAASVFYGLQIRFRDPGETSIFTLLVVSGAMAMALYHLCPISGPAYAFGSDFPSAMPEAGTLALHPQLIPPAPRNGMPSMHFAWALLLWMNARGLSRLAGAAFAVYAGLMLLATLALGEHYLVDLVAALPIALAVQALCTRALAWNDTARLQAIAAGTALGFAWILMVRFFPELPVQLPPTVWVLTVVTLWLSGRHLNRLTRAAAASHARRAPPLPPGPMSAGRDVWIAAMMFVVSGFAGLLYQVLFSKALALTFGSTATATYTVLATYMGGMALGAWLGGLLADRRGDALRLYGACELGIAAFCLATPLLFPAVRELYVVLASGAAPDAAMLTALRVALGAIALAGPTVLMGMTLPLLARFIDARQGSLGAAVALLYGANTLGAAFGALLAGYVVLPALGVLKTTLVAALANLMVALLAFRLSKSTSAFPWSPSASPARGAEERSLGTLALVLLLVGGFVTLALEVNYIHLLSVVAGNSVYAFSLMLFAFLLGLGLGAEAGRRLLLTRLPLAAMLALLEVGLAAVVLGGVFLWESLPGYFASFGQYPLTRTFASREFVRGAVCCLAMLPPAFFIGALYPVAMEAVGRAFPGRRFTALGNAAALNTAGNIAGVLAAGFVLLPALGALRSVQALAALSLLLGTAAMALSPWRRRPGAWAAPAGVAALLAVQPASFDYASLASGANVYFHTQPYGEQVLDHAESVDGGLTTVVATSHAGEGTTTLLTNGKFQGNDAERGEMPAQVGFASAPLLHTDARGSALVIGYGTGVSARTLSDSGFQRLDIVELSADIVRMANRHFGHVNDRVTERDGVEVYVTDGRNFLLLQDRAYDLVSMEISSIWFAGAASLYNREFYRLVERRLNPGGVLQQWLQLHHMAPVDIVHVIGSIRAEFRHVWLYYIGGQGILVATNDASRVPTRERYARLKATPSFARLLEILDRGGDLPSTVILHPAGVDALLAAFASPRGFPVSTDDNLFLEYHTPKGNALDGARSLEQNLRLLEQFSRPGGAPPGTP